MKTLLVPCQLAVPALSALSLKTENTLGYRTEETRRYPWLTRVLALEGVSPFTVKSVADEKNSRRKSARAQYWENIFFKNPFKSWLFFVSIILLQSAFVILLGLVLYKSYWGSISVGCLFVLLFLAASVAGIYLSGQETEPTWRKSPLNQFKGKVPKSTLEMALKIHDREPAAKFWIEYLTCTDAAFLLVWADNGDGTTTSYGIDFWEGSDTAMSMSQSQN